MEVDLRNIPNRPSLALNPNGVARALDLIGLDYNLNFTIVVQARKFLGTTRQGFLFGNADGRVQVIVDARIVFMRRFRNFKNEFGDTELSRRKLDFGLAPLLPLGRADSKRCSGSGLGKVA